MQNVKAILTRAVKKGLTHFLSEGEFLVQLVLFVFQGAPSESGVAAVVALVHLLALERKLPVVIVALFDALLLKIAATFYTLHRNCSHFLHVASKLQPLFTCCIEAAATFYMLHRNCSFLLYVACKCPWNISEKRIK